MTTRTVTVTDAAYRRMGVRAAEYVRQHGIQPKYGKTILVPAERATAGVERTLDRIYGAAATIDRGEVRYWVIDDVEDE